MPTPVTSPAPVLPLDTSPHIRSMRRVYLPLAVALSTLLLHLSSAHADVLVFRKGGEVELPAQIDGSIVRVQAPGRTLEFHRDDFAEIRPSQSPAQAWPARLEKGRSDGPRGLYQAAWWALENGLVLEAAPLLRQVHATDPSLAPVPRLVEVLDQLATPTPSPDLAATRPILPSNLQQAQSDHVLLLHQHDDAEAANLVANLESVFQTYYLLFTGLGFRLEIPPQKVILVWLANRRDYQQRVAKEGGEAMRNTGGYFSPARQLVFLSDSRSFPDYRASVEANLRRKQQWQPIADSIDQLPPQGRFRLELGGEPPRQVNRDEALSVVAALRREVDRQDLLLELRWHSVDLGTAAHELIHLLVAASGLAPRGTDFPLWLQEGLAMQFESVQGDTWTGVSRVHPRRLAEYPQAPPPALEPLLRDDGLGRGYNANRYAAAWAWVLYLRRREPDSFVTLLDLLRSPPLPSRPDAESRSLIAIREIYGNQLAPLESRWHRFMNDLELP